MLKKFLKKEGGFTLLELLIVIVIIGILALLIIPNITSAPKKARDTQRKTDLRAIQKGLEEYFVSNNVYPTVASAATADSALTALTAGTTPIMKTIPTDPKTPSTAPYQYAYSSAAGSAYTLSACLENGGDNGTSTDIPSKAQLGTCTTRSFMLYNNN